MDSIYIYSNPETAAPAGGQLKGLKIAVQPNFSVTGWPSEAGSKALLNFTALENATIVQRLREAGAFFCGSTHMSEFGFGLQNSGAGGALKHQAADAELVIDLMGEGRLAALSAAVCGFKPSYGLVSRFGLIDLIPSMECCAILSGNIQNIRDILKSAAGPDEKDFSLPDEPAPDFFPRIVNPGTSTLGFVKEAQNALPADHQKLFQTSIEELKKTGFSLRELSLPEFSLFSLVHKIVGSVEASSCAGRYDSVRYGQRAPGGKNWNEMYLLSRGAAFGPLLKSYLFQGAFFQFERYEAYEDACRIRARLVADMQKVTTQADFLVFPVFNCAPSGSPASLADTYSQFDSMLFANVTGQPVLYLPPSSETAGQGFQLVGPRLSDARLLDLGEYLLKTRRGGK